MLLAMYFCCYYKKRNKSNITDVMFHCKINVLVFRTNNMILIIIIIAIVIILFYNTAVTAFDYQTKPYDIGFILINRASLL